MKYNKKWGITTAITAICLMSTSPANAQIPTIDASSIAQIKDTITEVQQDVAIGRQIYSVGQQMYSAIGSSGGFSLSNIAQFAELFGQSSVGQQMLGQFGIDGNEFSDIATIGQAASLGAFNPSNFTGTNFNGAVNNIQSMFYTTGVSDLVQRENIMATRQGAARQASTQGYAMALTQRAQAQQAQQQSQALQNYVESAQNERDDIRANSIIELARYQQGQQQLAMQAAELQMMASQGIAQDGSLTMATSGVQK